MALVIAFRIQSHEHVFRLGPGLHRFVDSNARKKILLHSRLTACTAILFPHKWSAGKLTLSNPCLISNVLRLRSMSGSFAWASYLSKSSQNNTAVEKNISQEFGQNFLISRLYDVTTGNLQWCHSDPLAIVLSLSWFLPLWPPLWRHKPAFLWRFSARGQRHQKLSKWPCLASGCKKRAQSRAHEFHVQRPATRPIPSQRPLAEPLHGVPRGLSTVDYNEAVRSLPRAGLNAARVYRFLTRLAREATTISGRGFCLFYEASLYQKKLLISRVRVGKLYSLALNNTNQTLQRQMEIGKCCNHKMWKFSVFIEISMLIS